MKTFQEMYNKIYKDCYTLMQNNFPPKNTDEFWENYLMQADELSESYNKAPFVRGLILAISKELEARNNEYK